jgi:membrane associated rhomboid family serine protease
MRAHAISTHAADGGGVAFFAHVGGFVFGMLVTLALVNAGRLSSRSSAGLPTPI